MANQDKINRKEGGEMEKLPQEGYDTEVSLNGYCFLSILCGVWITIFLIMVIFVAIPLAIHNANKDKTPHMIYNVRLYYLGGHIKEKIYHLTKGTDLYIDSYKGDYYLKSQWRNSNSIFQGQEEVIEKGIVDFDILSIK